MPARVLRPVDSDQLLVEIVGRSGRYRVRVPRAQVRAGKVFAGAGEAGAVVPDGGSRDADQPSPTTGTRAYYRLLRIARVHGEVRIVRLGEHGTVGEAMRVAGSHPDQPSAAWAHQRYSLLWSKTDRNGLGFLIEREEPDRP